MVLSSPCRLHVRVARSLSATGEGLGVVAELIIPRGVERVIRGAVDILHCIVDSTAAVLDRGDDHCGGVGKGFATPAIAGGGEVAGR